MARPPIGTKPLAKPMLTYHLLDLLTPRQHWNKGTNSGVIVGKAVTMTP